MKTRVITGAVLVLVFVPLFIIGGYVLDIALGILAAAAAYELMMMFTKNNIKPFMRYCVIIHTIFAYIVLLYVLQGSLDPAWVIVMLLLNIITYGLFSVFIDECDGNTFGHALTSVFYPSLGFAAIALLSFQGLYVVGFLFLITTVTDVFAYIVGINFGKHRLAIKISPKKSIEGSIGGTFFALVFGLLYLYLINQNTIGNIELSLFVNIGLIIFLSIIAQIGDLVASKLKRTYDIKDFSNIFPGHGGVMDRFDSAIFAGMMLVLISEVIGLL